MIVKSLESGTEQGRYLSGQDGRLPPLRLGDGVYRLILTCPYGLCATKVMELLGQQLTAELTVEVQMKPTDEHGTTVVGEPEALISIVSSELKPLPKTSVLIRNADASRERWYATDDAGNAKVFQPDDPAIIVIVRGDKIYRYSLSGECRVRQAIDDGSECYSSAQSPIRFRLP